MGNRCIVTTHMSLYQEFVQMRLEVRAMARENTRQIKIRFGKLSCIMAGRTVDAGNILNAPVPSCTSRFTLTSLRLPQEMHLDLLSKDSHWYARSLLDWGRIILELTQYLPGQ